MAQRLTLTALRQLERSYRSGVEGTKEYLESVLQDRWDELPALLDIPRERVVRLLEREDALLALCSIVDEVSRGHRETKVAAARASAQTLGAVLAQRAELRNDGSYELDLELLSELLGLWNGSGLLVLGDRGAVEIPRLRALLRECSGLVSTSVVLAQTSVVVAYRTSLSRGTIRLALRSGECSPHVLYVPIGQASGDGAAHDDGFKHEASTVHGTVHNPWPTDETSAPTHPRPPRPPVRPFVEHVLDTLLAVVSR